MYENFALTLIKGINEDSLDIEEEESKISDYWLVPCNKIIIANDVNRMSELFNSLSIDIDFDSIFKIWKFHSKRSEDETWSILQDDESLKDSLVSTLIDILEREDLFEVEMESDLDEFLDYLYNIV